MAETRKLAAILAADVTGYSKLTGADEERTLARIRALRRRVARSYKSCRTGAPGDGIRRDRPPLPAALDARNETGACFIISDANDPAQSGSEAPRHGLRRLIPGGLETVTGSLFRLGPALPRASTENAGRGSQAVRAERPMDQRIELFLTAVLALAGEDPEAVREGVRVALADCEAIFRAREDNKRLKDQAARVCRALCRTRVVAEMHQRRGTRLEEHLKLVVSIMDRAGTTGGAPR
jgi:hypothetical protein